MQNMITLRHFTKSMHTTRHHSRMIDQIRSNQTKTLQRAASLIAHPRSLARRTPTWRPPSIHLPNTYFMTHSGLHITVSRYRIHAHERAILRAWDPTTSLLHSPAFVLTLRISSRDGSRVDPSLARAWVTAILPDVVDGTIHQQRDCATPTFCIVLDGRFHPLPSPAELFASQIAA